MIGTSGDMENSGFEVNATLLRELDSGEELKVNESHKFRIEAEEVNGRWPSLLAHVDNLFTLEEEAKIFLIDQGYELVPLSSEEDLKNAMDKSNNGVLNICIIVSVRKEESEDEDYDSEELTETEELES